MKGPVECMNSDQNMDNKGEDFSEYMWMAEEDIEEFDKQVEEELEEKLLMNEALDAFEEQQEAALYAQENLPLPRQRPHRNNQMSRPTRGFQHLSGGMNHAHINGFGDPAAGASGFVHPGQMPMMGEAPQQHRDLAAIAAASSLNPDAPAFVFNPNAPEFVPSWANAAPGGNNATSTAAAAAAAANGTSTAGPANGSGEAQ